MLDAIGFPSWTIERESALAACPLCRDERVGYRQYRVTVYILYACLSVQATVA
jgi:hypothetical protein